MLTSVNFILVEYLASVKLERGDVKYQYSPFIFSNTFSKTNVYKILSGEINTMKKDKIKVAVHGGTFHADEVFAIAILRLVYPNLEITRTMDAEVLENVDFRVDVGGKYDVKTNDFDHHQKEFKEKRDNNILYASAGLIWKHFGRDLVNSDDAWKAIEMGIIQYIDAVDVGVKTYDVKEVRPYDVADFIHGLNPVSDSKEEFDKCFEEAVSIITKLLALEIQKAEIKIAAREIVRGKIKESNGDYMVLENYVPWKEVVVNESDLKYVVLYNSMVDRWSAVAVPVEIGSFDNRRDFPKTWGGLTDEEFQKVSGVKDAIFCHASLFFMAAKSREGIIQLVELALK